MPGHLDVSGVGFLRLRIMSLPLQQGFGLSAHAAVSSGGGSSGLHLKYSKSYSRPRGCVA